MVKLRGVAPVTPCVTLGRLYHVVLGVTSALYFVMAHVMKGLKGVSGAGFSFGEGIDVPYQMFMLGLGSIFS